MAENQKLLTPVVDLFGFAELTGEICDVPTPCVTQTQRAQVYPKSSSFENNQTLAHRRDDNEVIVPILSDRRGFTKYKVLARLKPEEDEVTKPPSHRDIVVSLDKSRPMCESVKQKKEKGSSIVPKQKNYHKELKKKPDHVKPISNSNLKCKAALNKSKTGCKSQKTSKMCKPLKLKQKCKLLVRNRDREKKTSKLKLMTRPKLFEDVHGVMSEKQNLAKRPETFKEKDLNPKTQANANLQRKDDDEMLLVNPSQTSDIVGKVCGFTDHGEGLSCVRNELGSLASSNAMKKLEGPLIDLKTNLKEKSLTDSERMDVTESELDSSQSGGERDKNNSGNSYIHSAQPLNKCFVSIERCPSSEELSKEFLDNTEHSTPEKKHKVSPESETKIRKSTNVSKQGSDSGSSISDLTYQVSVKRKKSSDERTAMVYDTNIDVRKSGRLKSAKCASRYRGDYGIRADIYNKITYKKIENHSNKHSSVDNDTSVIAKTFNNVPLKEESCSFSPSEKNEDRFGNEMASQEETFDHINPNCALNIMPKNETSSNCHIQVIEEPGILKQNSQVPCSELLKRKKSTDSCDFTDNGSLPYILTSSQNSANSENSSDSNFSQEDVSQENFQSVLGKAGYVHSVGKSVNKKQNYILKRSRCESNEKEMFLPLSPESTPEKCDSSQLLEKLRCKMFEKVGLTAQVEDTQPKQFESKLISSKLKKTSLDFGQGSHTVHSITSEQASIPKSFLGCMDYHKSPPRCSTPAIVSSTVSILDEVAEKLNSMHKAKRKSEGKQSKPKRQRFQEKKFMLRSMFKGSKTFDELHLRGTHNSLHDEESSSVIGETTDSDLFSNTCDDTDVRSVDDSFTDSHKADNSNAESDVMGDKTKAKNVDKKERAISQNICDIQETNIVKKKPKSVKCHACSQTFRSKELMRKHYPCRVRQTRTWSQNKLRPNRVFRNDNFSRKKVNKLNAKLSKSGKQNKARPQLLTPRKTKFRRVKGKRRRRLHLLIQELMSKRQIMDWPHLNVLYTHLSFKEQCLYRLGLFCVGNKSEGLENYSEEDLRVFKVHQEKEKELYFSRNFKHIFPSSDDESRDSISDSKEICDTYKNVPSVNDTTEFSDSFNTCKETFLIENLSAEKDTKCIDDNFINIPCASTSCELSQNENDMSLSFGQTHSSITDRFLKKSDSYEVKDGLSKEGQNKEIITKKVIQHSEQDAFEKNIELVEDQQLNTTMVTNNVTGGMHEKQNHAPDKIKSYFVNTDLHFPKAGKRLPQEDSVKFSTQVSTMVEESSSVLSDEPRCKLTSHSQLRQINEQYNDDLENAKFQVNDHQNEVKLNVFTHDMSKQKNGDTSMIESENHVENELMNSDLNVYFDTNSEFPKSGLCNIETDTQTVTEEVDSTDSVPNFTDKDFSCEFQKENDTEHNNYEINGSHVEGITASSVKSFENECFSGSENTLRQETEVDREFQNKFKKDVSEKCDIDKLENRSSEFAYSGSGNTIQESNEIEKETFYTHKTTDIRTNEIENYFESQNTPAKETEVNSEFLNSNFETDACQACDVDKIKTKGSQNFREITDLGIGNNLQKNNRMKKYELYCGNTLKEPESSDSEVHDTSFSVSDCTDNSLAISPEVAAHEVIEKFFLISEKIEAYMHHSITDDRQSNSSSFQTQNHSAYKNLSFSNQTGEIDSSLTESTVLKQKESSSCNKTIGGEENIERFFELSEKLEAYIQNSTASHMPTNDVSDKTLVKTKKEELFWANKYVPETDTTNMPSFSKIENSTTALNDGEMSFEDGCIKRFNIKVSNYIEKSNRQKQDICLEENVFQATEINSDQNDIASTFEKFSRDDTSCKMTVHEESLIPNEHDFDLKSNDENMHMQASTNKKNGCCIESLSYSASSMTNKEKEISDDEERANSLQKEVDTKTKDENISTQNTSLSESDIRPSSVSEKAYHEMENVMYLEQESSASEQGLISIQVNSECKIENDDDGKGHAYKEKKEPSYRIQKNTNEINKNDEDSDFDEKQSVKNEGLNTIKDNHLDNEEKTNKLIIKTEMNSKFRVKYGSFSDLDDTANGKESSVCNNYCTNKESSITLDIENLQTISEPKIKLIEIDIADVEENVGTIESLEDMTNEQQIATIEKIDKEMTGGKEKESNSTGKCCSMDEDFDLDCDNGSSKGNIPQVDENNLEMIKKTEGDKETYSDQSWSDFKSIINENESTEEINDSLVPISSSPILKSCSPKAQAIIKYKINGVYFSENLETGVKEVITDEFCVTDINIESSQESSFEVSKDEDGSVIEHSDVNKEALEYNYESEVASSDLKTVEIPVHDENEIVPINVTENTNSCATDMSLSNTLHGKGNTKLNESPQSQEELFIDNAGSLNYCSVSGLETDVQPNNIKSDEIIEDSKETNTHSLSPCDSPVEEDKENINIERSKEKLSISPGDEIEIMRSESEPNIPNNSLGLALISSDCLSCKGEQSTGLFENIVEDEDIEAIHTEPPPILEKEVEDTSTLNFVTEQCGLIMITEPDPPILEPVKRPILERHFLDIIGEIYEKKKDDDVKVTLTGKHFNGTKESFDLNLNKKLQKSNEDLPATDSKLSNKYNSCDDELHNSLTEFSYKEDIGRHFSDVIDATCAEKPKLPEMQMLFEKSEKGDVTLAQIRSLLSPTSKKGIEIPKDSLLRIRSGVENIISKVKLPTKKDPVWLKRDALLNYKSREDKDVRCEDTVFNGGAVKEIKEKEYQEDEQISSNYNDSTSGSITNSILQMLTSLEDKGSFAENMTNLLHILAENLGFSRSNSDSNEEYLCREGVEKDIVSNNRLSLDDFESQLLEIGEEPPPLDEISFEGCLSPLAGINDDESNNCIEKNDFEKYLNTDDQSDFEDGKFEEEGSVLSDEERINDLSSKFESIESKIDAERQSTKIQTLFKSITELNSIETDDDSESEEIFDVATMSQRMSELKSISKDAAESDVNSEVFSDDENCSEEDLGIHCGDQSKICTDIFEKYSVESTVSEDLAKGQGINETDSSHSIHDKNFRCVESIQIDPNQKLSDLSFAEEPGNDKSAEEYQNFLPESCVEETDKLKDLSKGKSVKGDSSTQNNFDSCLIFGYGITSERNLESDQYFPYNSNSKEQPAIENYEKEEISKIYCQSDNFKEIGQDSKNALSNEKEGFENRYRRLEVQTEDISNEINGPDNLKESEKQFIKNSLPSNNSNDEIPLWNNKNVQKKTGEIFWQKQGSNKKCNSHAEDEVLEIDNRISECVLNENRHEDDFVDKETNKEFEENLDESFVVEGEKTKDSHSFIELKEITKTKENYTERKELSEFSDQDNFMAETEKECDSDDSMKCFEEMMGDRIEKSDSVSSLKCTKSCIPQDEERSKASELWNIQQTNMHEVNRREAYISDSVLVSEDNEMAMVQTDVEYFNSNGIYRQHDLGHLNVFENNLEVKKNHLSGCSFEKKGIYSQSEFVEHSSPLSKSLCNSHLSISLKDHENISKFTTNGIDESSVRFPIQHDSKKSEKNKELPNDNKNNNRGKQNLEQLFETSLLENYQNLEKNFASQEEKICQSPSLKKSYFDISSNSLNTGEKSISRIEMDSVADFAVRKFDKCEAHEELIQQNMESCYKDIKSTKTCDVVIESPMNANETVGETIRDSITTKTDSNPNVGGSSTSDKDKTNENNEIDIVRSYSMEKKFELNHNEERDIQSESTINDIECNHQGKEMETHDDPEQIIDIELTVKHGNLTAQNVTQQIFDRETTENHCNLTIEEGKGLEFFQSEGDDIVHFETQSGVPGESNVHEANKPSDDSLDGIRQASLNSKGHEFLSCNGVQCVDEDSNNTVVYETEVDLATDNIEIANGASFKKQAFDIGEFANRWNFGGFCETIAEKVKRKQKERLIKLDQARSRYGAFYSQPKNSTDRQKEFSVFRKTMLQTKADRNKKRRLTVECDNQENNKRARSTSVPKDMHMPPCSVVLDEIVNEITEKKIPNQIDVKPCSVKLERLDKKIVERYTEKVDEVTHFPVSRPPIRFKISLKNLCVKPCSPRPSYISDAASGNSSGMEESESEYSDDISEKDSVCIENGEWVQSAQYKVYEIKNSPRTFHKNLDECKPIKLKVKSVTTNVDEGDEKLVQEAINEKVNRSLFSAFDDVLLKNLPSPLIEINENDNTHIVTKKSPVKATWIKDLKLSDSDSSENESDKEEPYISTAKSLYNTESKQARSLETVIVSENSGKQTVDIGNCLDNICSLESLNLESTDYSETESAEFKQMENEFLIDRISNDQKVIQNSNKNFQEASMLSLESDPSHTLEKTSNRTLAIKTGSQHDTLEQEIDHNLNKNQYTSTDDQLDCFDNITEMEKSILMEKKETTPNCFEADDRLLSVEGNSECDLTTYVSLGSDMHMPMIDFEKSLESALDFNTEQVERWKETVNPQVVQTVCSDSFMDGESMLKTDKSKSNEVLLYRDFITKINSTEEKMILEESETPMLVDKSNEQDPSQEVSNIDGSFEVDAVETSQDPGKFLAEKSPSFTVKEVKVNDSNLRKGNCEKSFQSKKGYEEDLEKIPNITELEKIEIQGKGVELESSHTSEIFICDLNEKDSEIETGKVKSYDSGAMDMEENSSTEIDLNVLPDEGQKKIRDKDEEIKLHNETEKLIDINELEKTEIEDEGANLDSSNACNINTKEHTVGISDQNYDRSFIEVENNCTEKDLKELPGGEQDKNRGKDKETKQYSETEKLSHITNLESTKTRVERVELNISDTFELLANDLDEKVHATERISDQKYERSATEKADSGCAEKDHSEIPECKHNEMISNIRERKQHCEREQDLQSVDLCSSERENDLAIVSLENENFNKSYIPDIAVEEGDEIIYYAVEVNDDYETNEAISDIEQCVQERLIPDCEQVAVLETCELQTDIIESIAVEGYEIQEGNVCENVFDIGEANEIVGHEEIIPGNEVETCSTEMTGISCVAMVETQNRFLCGINEDSQSSQELIEECVMDFSEVQLQNSL